MNRILLSTVIFPNRCKINRGVYVKKLALEMARRGELTVVVPIPYFPPFMKDGKRDYFARIPLEDVIDGLPVSYPRFFIIPKLFRFLHGPSLFFSVFRFYQRLVTAEKPEVLLGFWAFPDGFANVLMAKFFGLPVVIGCRGSDINKLARPRMQRMMIGWALRNCDQVLAVSKALKRDIVEELRVPAQRVTVIPNGIEEDRFYPRDRNETRAALQLDREQQIVICVARLEPVKGVGTLIRAFARLVGGNQRLVIIGDGAEMTHLRKLIEELGESERISLVGAKPHDEIPLWINAADLVVLSSISEGWPNVLMESFACGKPVVATRVGGVPEIVNSPSLGILADPGDVDDLARAIEGGLVRSWDSDTIRARIRGRSWAVVAEELHTELKLVLRRYRERRG